MAYCGDNGRPLQACASCPSQHSGTFKMTSQKMFAIWQRAANHSAGLTIRQRVDLLQGNDKVKKVLPAAQRP